MQPKKFEDTIQGIAFSLAWEDSGLGAFWDTAMGYESACKSRGRCWKVSSQTLQNLRALSMEAPQYMVDQLTMTTAWTGGFLGHCKGLWIC